MSFVIGLIHRSLWVSFLGLFSSSAVLGSSSSTSSEFGKVNTGDERVDQECVSIEDTRLEPVEWSVGIEIGMTGLDFVPQLHRVNGVHHRMDQVLDFLRIPHVVLLRRFLFGLLRRPDLHLVLFSLTSGRDTGRVMETGQRKTKTRSRPVDSSNYECGQQLPVIGNETGFLALNGREKVIARVQSDRLEKGIHKTKTF